MNYAEFHNWQQMMLDDPQNGSEKLFNQFQEIISRSADCKVCITLDWLSVLFVDKTGLVPEAEGKEDSRAITETITLKYWGKGNEHYKYIWNVLKDGEHLATILSHTRNEKFVKKGAIKIDFKNHLLYTSSLWPLYDELIKVFKLDYKNIGRVDIAIDGLNYVMQFVNLYVKQEPDRKVMEMCEENGIKATKAKKGTINKPIEMKGGRPMFHSKVLDRKTMQYQNFALGSGRKSITMYNKSLDIVKKQKIYIQDYWLANGICKEALPIKQLGELYKDTDNTKTYLDGYENIYRFEVRLKGEMISQIKDFSVDWLKDKDWLMSIVKRMNENYFEFVYYTFFDISKCKGVDLMPYDLYDIKNIILNKAKPTDDLYKTKLSIKKNVRQLYLHNLVAGDYGVMQMIAFDVSNFQLENWFANKLLEWTKEYEAIQPDAEYAIDVGNFLTDISNKLLNKEIIGTLIMA